MKNGGIDKRVIKTKNAIFEAFKQLVQEKDMSDITISELTQKANITRSTFYMYYNTVGDVRTDIENTIMARIDRIMSETDIRNSIRNPYPLLSMLADEILKQDQNNRYILSSSTSGQLMDKINDRIVEAYMHWFKENEGSTNDIGKSKIHCCFCGCRHDGMFQNLVQPQELAHSRGALQKHFGRNEQGHFLDDGSNCALIRYIGGAILKRMQGE